MWSPFKPKSRRFAVRTLPDPAPFRRGRAITGSASSGVSAAASSASSRLASPRLKLHHLRAARRAILAGLSVILTASLGLAWLIGQFINQPVEVVLVSQAAIIGQPYTKNYSGALSGYFAANPTERFRFNLNQANMQSYLIARHPEINTAQIVQSGRSVKLAVGLRQPVVTWRLGSEQLYIDSAGVVFKNNYFAQPAINVEDQSGLPIKDKTVIASDRFLAFLGQLIAYINASGVGPVSNVIIPPGITREVDIRLQNRPYVIKAFSGREAYGQAADIVSAVKYVQSHQLTPQYLDVRVPGKAFYR